MGQSEPAKKTIGVVLVNWNNAECTIPCIASIKAGIVKPVHIIVVDNASQDGSAAEIRRIYHDVLLVENTTNYGFTGANNIGMRRLLALGADYIWILNNDTEVAPECLQNLLEPFALGGTGATTGKIYYYQLRNKLWYAGTMITEKLLKWYHRGQDEIDRGQYGKTEEISAFDGCCVLLDVRVIADVGFFDEHFFAYNEDIDYSFRLRHHGYKILYTPNAALWHKVGSSMTKNRPSSVGGTSTPLQYYLSQRNRIYIMRRYGTLFQKCIGIISATGYTMFLTVILIMLLRYEKIHAAWKGIYHGLTDNIDDIKKSLSAVPYE